MRIYVTTNAVTETLNAQRSAIQVYEKQSNQEKGQKSYVFRLHLEHAEIAISLSGI